MGDSSSHERDQSRSIYIHVRKNMPSMVRAGRERAVHVDTSYFVKYNQQQQQYSIYHIFHKSEKKNELVLKHALHTEDIN